MILAVMKERLKGWRHTVDLEMRPRRNQRLLDECDMRLTIEDVENFKGSKPVIDARKTFRKTSDGIPLTKDEICEARDLLICLITIKTGTRPGALENAQLQHYRTMRRDPINGDAVMLIPEHKRSVDGPAMLALEEELVDLLSIYVEKIHPQFPSPRDDYLFLQSSGRRFANGTINRRLSEMWLRSGVRPDLRVTATNIRKFIVTVLQENKTAGAEFDESGVRIAMCHTQKTAMNSYLREDLTAVASRAARTIKQFTDRSSNYQPLNKPVNQPVVAVDREASNSCKEATSTFNTQHLSKLGNDNVAYLQPDDVGGVDVEPNLPSSERRPLTDDDKDSRNSECERPSTFMEHSRSKSVNECDMGVDEEDPNGNYGKEAPNISNRQLLSKPASRHDAAVPVDKEPSNLEQDV